MIDFAKIKVKAGNGGTGGVSFAIFRGPHVGKPEGGDGGKGGDVYIRATTEKNTLAEFSYNKVFEAQNGGRGGRNNRKGASGDDTVITVPIGTIIKDTDLGLEFDLDRDGKSVQIALGGFGGHGNARLKSMRVDKRSNAYWEAVHVAGPGGEGEEKNLTLELKLLADVGLVGLPNAGKSTLLSVLTEAKPKIADYPFTTLEPYLGVMAGGEKKATKSLVLADIPGLIEGAAEGRGLGVEFLRHIQRTQLLVHVVSSENHEPLTEYKKINKELSNFDPKLGKRPQIVVLNKIDIIDKNEIDTIVSLFKKQRVRIIPISAATLQNVEILRKEIFKKFQTLKSSSADHA